MQEWNQWVKVARDSIPMDLNGAILNGVNLSGADLNLVSLQHAKLVGTKLVGANLSFTDAYGTTLTYGDSFEATMRQADFSNANLSKATLFNTNLSNANFAGAKFSESVFRNTHLESANFTNVQCDFTVFANLDLRTVEGLDTIQHIGPSQLSIDTIYRSKGLISHTFLLGCGVPEDMIAYIRSIAGAIQYYTVFISYSSQNRDFTQRLFNDLRGAGIQCWFDQRSLKAGDPFWEEIDQAIIQFDKFIVVLSESSINSPNVEREVQLALDKELKLHEQEKSETVLFPIKIDHAIEKASIHWAADIQHGRHILDFTGWRNPDDYQVIFGRLLEDLKNT